MTGKFLNKNTIFLIYMICLGVAALGFAITKIPSPFMQRQIQFDSQRVTDLQSIKYAIDDFYTRNSRLPFDLNEISSSTNYTYYASSLKKVDPDTRRPYEYVRMSDYNYKLCAEFGTDSKSQSANSTAMDYNYSISSQYPHPAGRFCYDYKENQQLLPLSVITITPTPNMVCMGAGCPPTPTPYTVSPMATPTPLYQPAPSGVDSGYPTAAPPQSTY